MPVFRSLFHAARMVAISWLLMGSPLLAGPARAEPGATPGGPVPSLLESPSQQVLPAGWDTADSGKTAGNTADISAPVLPASSKPANADSIWLREPGERLESEVAFDKAFAALLPEPDEKAGLRLGLGSYGSQQAVAMGLFRSLRSNTLLNFTLSSDPDLGGPAARGGILIHW